MEWPAALQMGRAAGAGRVARRLASAPASPPSRQGHRPPWASSAREGTHDIRLERLRNKIARAVISPNLVRVWPQQLQEDVQIVTAVTYAPATQTSLHVKACAHARCPRRSVMARSQFQFLSFLWSYNAFADMFSAPSSIAQATDETSTKGS